MLLIAIPFHWQHFHSVFPGKINLSVVTFRFHITFPPIFPLYIKYFVEI